MTFVAILLVAVAVGVVGSMLGIGAASCWCPFSRSSWAYHEDGIGCSLVSVIATSSRRRWCTWAAAPHTRVWA